MKMKRITAGLAALCMLCAAVPMTATGIGDMVSISASAASGVADLLAGSTSELTNAQLVGAGQELTEFSICGRTYQNGIQFDGFYNKESSVTIDVSKVEAMRFIVGHVDGGEVQSAKFHVFIDGNEYPEAALDLSNTMSFQQITLDTKEYSTVKLVVDDVEGWNKEGTYGVAQIETESVSEDTPFSAPSYKTGADVTANAYNLFSAVQYPIVDEETAAKTRFSMSGATFNNGIVATPAYNSYAAFGINTDNAEKLIFTVGHVDDGTREDATLHIFLNGTELKNDQFPMKLTNTMALRTVELPVKKYQTVQFVLDSVDAWSSSGTYGFADFRTESAQDSTPYTNPEYTTGKSITDAVYNIYNGTNAYPIKQDAFDKVGKYITIGGRTFTNGVSLTPAYNGYASFGINVEDIDELSFTYGHMDDETHENATMRIYLDDEEYTFDADGNAVSPIALTDLMELRDITLPVKDVRCVQIVLNEVKSWGQSGTYAFCDFRTDKITDDAAYTLPTYEEPADIAAYGYNKERVDVYPMESQNELDDTPVDLVMNGNTYEGGLVLNGHYNTVAAVGFNTEELSELSFVVGHVDDKGHEAAKLHIYLDGVEAEGYPLALSDTMQLTPIKLDVTDTRNVQITVDEIKGFNADGIYGLGDIHTEKIASETPYTAPEYKDHDDLITNIFNPRNLEVYPIEKDSKYDADPSFTVGGTDYTRGILMNPSYSNGNSYFGINTENVNTVALTLGILDGKKDDATLNVYFDGELYEPYAGTVLKAGEAPKTIYLPVYTVDSVRIETTCEAYGGTSVGLVDFKLNEITHALGDVTGDQQINAADATELLLEAARMGAGAAAEFTEPQTTAADVNKDGDVNSVDASIILQYSAAVGAGQADAKIEDFV